MVSGIINSRNLNDKIKNNWTSYGNNDYKQQNTVFRAVEVDPVTDLPVFLFTQKNSKRINFIIHPFYKLGHNQPYGWISTKKIVANSLVSLGPKVFMMFDKDYEVRNYFSADICKHRLFISGNMKNYDLQTMSLAAFVTISNPSNPSLSSQSARIVVNTYFNMKITKELPKLPDLYFYESTIPQKFSIQRS